MRRPEWIRANVVAGLQGIVAEFETIFSGNAIDPGNAAAFSCSVATGPSVSAVTPAPLSTVTGLYAAFVALYNAMPMLVSGVFGIDPSVGAGLVALAEGLVAAMDPLAAAAAFASAADSASDPAPPSVNATLNRQDDGFNAALLARFSRMVFLAAYVEALVGASFPTRAQAITARADCVQRFERELMLCGLGPDIGVATALTNMRDRCVAWLSQAIVDAKPVLNISAAAELPVLVAAWRLYQDPERASDLIARNRVPVAEFLAREFEALAA